VWIKVLAPRVCGDVVATGATVGSDACQVNERSRCCETVGDIVRASRALADFTAETA